MKGAKRSDAFDSIRKEECRAQVWNEAEYQVETNKNSDKKIVPQPLIPAR